MSSRVSKPKEKKGKRQKGNDIHLPTYPSPVSLSLSHSSNQAQEWTNNNACGPVNEKEEKNEHETDRAMKGKYAAYTGGEYEKGEQGHKQGRNKDKGTERRGRLSLSCMHDDWSQHKVVKIIKCLTFLTCSMLSPSLLSRLKNAANKENSKLSFALFYFWQVRRELSKRKKDSGYRPIVQSRQRKNRKNMRPQKENCAVLMNKRLLDAHPRCQFIHCQEIGPRASSSVTVLAQAIVLVKGIKIATFWIF